MSVHITRRVWIEGPLDRTLRFVLLAIADHANEAGEAFPSVSLLAKECCLSERSVISSVNELERQGYLKRVSRGRNTAYLVSLRKLGIGEVASPKKGEGRSSIEPTCEIGSTPLVKSTASIGEIHDKPPAPPYRSNHQEPPYEPPVATLPESAVSRICAAAPELNAFSVRSGLAKTISEEKRRGCTIEELVQVLPGQWLRFVAARDNGRFRIGGWGPANFFAGGHWRDESKWPWRPEFQPEPKMRYRDLATIYSSAEYQPAAKIGVAS